MKGTAKRRKGFRGRPARVVLLAVVGGGGVEEALRGRLLGLVADALWGIG